MKKNLFLVTGIILMLLMFTACPDDYYHGIWLGNNSNRNIVAFIGGEGLGEPIYPDTLLPSKNLTSPVFKNITKFGFTKEINTSKVCVFFIDNDTITKYGWDKVRDDYMILKRYDVDQAFLKQVDWTIVYEDMK